MIEKPIGNFWYFLELMAKRRNFIISFVLILTLIAVIVSFVLPKKYKATAIILPPKDFSTVTPGGGYLSDAVSLTKGVSLPIMVTPSDVYAQMLKSTTIAERIIDTFNLMEYYHTDNFTDTYEALMYYSDFRVSDVGLLEVSFMDKDPARSAEIANTFIKELEIVNRTIVSDRLKQNKNFIEERLKGVKNELDSTRKVFEEFQMTNKAIDFNEQTRLAIDQAVALKIKMAELDLNIKIKETKLGKDHSDLKELVQQYQTVKDQLNTLENKNADSSFFSLPISAIPSLRGQYETLYSRVKVNESLYKILLEQFEQVKFQEQENTPVLSVLDWARIPEVRYSPKRTLIVVSTFALSLLLSILLAAFAEYYQRLEKTDPEDYKRLSMFLHSFLGWLPGMKRH
ncbi:MAG: Wzz/FepE/Etk N-terminal domain-containing protein [bacterium]